MTKYVVAVLLFCTVNIAHAQQFDIIVDEHWSPYAGAALNQSIFHVYTTFDDKNLPSSIGKTGFLWGTGRLGKILLEDLFSSFLMVVQHEIFGHGYRGREFGFSNISYSLGLGHGSTSFSLTEYYSLSFTEQAALSAAGMEADTILSEQIRKRWFLSDKIDRRDALLFLQTALDQPNYIYGTDDESFVNSNDVNSYVTEINEWYGKTVLSKRQLRHRDYWDLFDPTIYFSVYSLIDYVLNAKANSPMFMFNIKNYRYLPTPRLLLAPYGPEFQLQNHVVTPKESLIQINLRYGNTGSMQTYGIDFFMWPIISYNNVEFGNKLYVWRQPLFLTQNDAVGIQQRIGVADLVSIIYKMNNRWAILNEIGYKTSGYIPGDALGNSWIWRMGVRYEC